ncbi:hypothetical protein LIER_31724 [Lithospermum erythrorhizon]|uniref:Uncharacterized protein n=1 Tax=Lithospermum erythrorhizon TaxID=34254 RepID=A0AAV3RXR4_LITER
MHIEALLKAKVDKAIVPHQVSYLDVISGNRLIDQMFVSQLTSSSAVALPSSQEQEQLMITENSPLTILPTPTPIIPNGSSPLCEALASPCIPSMVLSSYVREGSSRGLFR